MLAAAFILICPDLHAATVSVSWDPVTLDVEGKAESVGYYVVYYGLSSRPQSVTHPSDPDFQYDSVVEVGTVTSVQRSDLTDHQRYYFSVAAVDVMGNISDYSSEFVFDVTEDPDPPVDPDDNFEGGCGCAGMALHNGMVLWILLTAMLLTMRKWWGLRKDRE